ncbi:protein of unknown function [Gordonia westfalica]|uniref:DUF350 domain-containing protein n=1 Tax=Gordonia westfalica TaxID=158898 RepID=A0A1H2KCX3_9ACTN|nr:protein of unknown function [Gordonia westfalica]
MELLRDNLAAGASFSLVGIALLVVGFVALDLVTPGRLRQLVWIAHNRNAVILTTSMVIGLAIVLVCSVIDTELLALWRALLYTVAYVILTIAVMMWSFVLIDWLTPASWARCCSRTTSILPAGSPPRSSSVSAPSSA